MYKSFSAYDIISTVNAKFYRQPKDLHDDDVS